MKGANRGQLRQAMVIKAGYDDATIAGSLDQVIDEATAQGHREGTCSGIPTTSVLSHELTG